MRAELTAIDDRRALWLRCAHQVCGFFGKAMAEENETVGLSSLQHRSVSLLTFEIVLGVSEQDSISLAQSCLFDTLENQREKRIRNVRHRDQEFAGSQRSQVFRCRIRHVADAVNSLHDFAPSVRRHY